jgi:signal transduction histidine kinase
VFFAPLIFALILVFGPRWVKRYEAVKTGVEEVRSGNLSWRIPVEKDAHGELDELARGINEISEASNAAIQNELKTQRLKTDLISNVSHDLKTPLTSIISYVDLLKREGIDSPSAPEYLDILDRKSQRMKKVADDLFEAAKASSGAIPVRFEKVDMLSLIRQGLGEMNDVLSSRRFDVKLGFESERRYYVRADGRLLWRIVENLLGNVRKYALEGSRVYIDLSEKQAGGGMSVLEMKNISEAQLNISADELTERFTRGDESRATDGSGLGLAIARDLARLQNGWFEIKIDGDLFKAVLMLETWKED